MKNNYDSREYREMPKVTLREIESIARISSEDAAQLYFIHKVQLAKGERKYR